MSLQLEKLQGLSRYCVKKEKRTYRPHWKKLTLKSFFCTSCRRGKLRLKIAEDFQGVSLRSGRFKCFHPSQNFEIWSNIILFQTLIDVSNIWNINLQEYLTNHLISVPRPTLRKTVATGTGKKSVYITALIHF